MRFVPSLLFFLCFLLALDRATRHVIAEVHERAGEWMQKQVRPLQTARYEPVHSQSQRGVSRQDWFAGFFVHPFDALNLDQSSGGSLHDMHQIIGESQPGIIFVQIPVIGGRIVGGIGSMFRHSAMGPGSEDPGKLWRDGTVAKGKDTTSIGPRQKRYISESTTGHGMRSGQLVLVGYCT